MDLHGRNLLKEIDLTRAEFCYLVAFAGQLRDEKRGDLTVRLWKSASLSGTVVDETGSPAIGYPVRVIRRSALSFELPSRPA
jgi:hypothetical protein